MNAALTRAALLVRHAQQVAPGRPIVEYISTREAILCRMYAQGTTRLIAIHQMHRTSHVDIHSDPPLCSLVGVYPRFHMATSAHHPHDRLLERVDRRVRVASPDVTPPRAEVRRRKLCARLPERGALPLRDE